MMNNLKKGMLLFMAVLIAGGVNMYAQNDYKLNGVNTMKLSGTSTLHKWSMTSKTVNSDAQFNFETGSEHTLTAVKSLSFTLPSLSLKSGTKGLDKNAYKALKTDKYKNILYNLTAASVSAVTANKYLVKTQGNLSIAGITKDVAMDVFCMVNKDESITCTGSSKMKMTDYGVKPPTFMSGAMKTGDAITLDFIMVYKP